MMAKQFFIRRSGKVVGPILADKLKENVASGKIRVTDQVGESNEGPWHVVGEVPTFEKMLSPEEADPLDGLPTESDDAGQSYELQSREPLEESQPDVLPYDDGFVSVTEDLYQAGNDTYSIRQLVGVKKNHRDETSNAINTPESKRRCIIGVLIFVGGMGAAIALVVFSQPSNADYAEHGLTTVQSVSIGASLMIMLLSGVLACSCFVSAYNHMQRTRVTSRVFIVRIFNASGPFPRSYETDDEPRCDAIISAVTESIRRKG
jgi:hypothetical protein